MGPNRIGMQRVRLPPSRLSGIGDHADLGEGETVTQSHIKVVVRIRPENGKEREGGYNIAVKPLDEHILIFDPKEQSSPEYFHGRLRRGRDFLKKKNRDLRYAFDRVFDENTPNMEVYENTTKCILDGLLDGYNCSVFAYGATGAGKTFTMLGSQQNPGVIFHTMMDLYQRIANIKDEKTCQVAVSYLEVYNEQIRDLLVPGPFLPIREDPLKGVMISGLSLHKPGSAAELLHMLEFGNRNRTQHPTDANAESSRSHAVFQVFVRQQDRTANLSADVRIAKMSLIDLAGSERATVTTNRGARFREGANINRSLLALGNCINALAEGKGKNLHVPYRNSKLTRLLKDSLGGNCRTVMIAAVSPSAQSYDDTHNTLKYANRAKNIKASLKRNVVSVDFHVTKYAKIVDELRKEVGELKTKLRGYEEGLVIPTPVRHGGALASVQGEQEIHGLQGVLHGVFSERMNIRKEILEFESTDRDLAFRIQRKEQCLTRLSSFFVEPSACAKAQDKLESNAENFKSRRHILQSRIQEVQQRMTDNSSWLSRVESEMQLAGKDNCMPEILQLGLRTHHLEVELRDTKRQVKHLCRMSRAQDRELSASEKLITALLRTAKKQYLLLKGHGFATSDVLSDYECLQQMLTGEREVAWADQTICDKSVHENTSLVLNEIMELPVLSCVRTTPQTPARRMKRSPRKSPYVSEGMTPRSVRQRPTPPHRRIVTDAVSSPYTTPTPYKHTDIKSRDSGQNTKPLNPDTTVHNTVSNNGALTSAITPVHQGQFNGSQTVTLNPNLCTHLNSYSNVDVQVKPVPLYDRQVTPSAGEVQHHMLSCSSQSIQQQQRHSVCSTSHPSSHSHRVNVNMHTNHHTTAGQQPQHPVTMATSNEAQTSSTSCHKVIPCAQSGHNLNETFSLSEDDAHQETGADRNNDNKESSHSREQWTANDNAVISVTKLCSSAVSVNGSATVTKSQTDSDRWRQDDSSSRPGDAQKLDTVPRRVARAMDFSSVTSPAGLRSYADAVRSPSTVVRQPLQNVTNSPLAVPLDFSGDAERGRKPYRKVTFPAHENQLQQQQQQNYRPAPLTMAGTPQVTSLHSHKNDSFRPYHKNSVLRSKNARFTSQTEQVGGGGRRVKNQNADFVVSVSGQKNIEKLEKLGLPSMVNKPNYMKSTTAVSLRNQHGRSKSSSNLQEYRRMSMGPPSRQPIENNENRKPPMRTLSLSRCKSAAQLHSRPAWNR